ncbi:hypothetical protein A3F66_00760 [candidate division TM6 bacterium RIFCSPHIGHO2_12_FULL_32_22]|nr:MAG: hypothetical protein A3F66_00760 [candidate division TM6 bacterium RIFCSPHIGHO2_12_FULL_32_22]
MKINGTIFKSGKFWLADIPSLDLIVQSKTKKEIPLMVSDAIELLIDDPNFNIKVDIEGDELYIKSNNLKKLIALILKRLRLKNRLRLEDVAKKLSAKSINEYAQYEQAKHLPSLDKLDELLKAIDPTLESIITLR